MEREQLQAHSKQERFVQISVPSEVEPKVTFGKIILDQNKYAVSYEDSGHKIPYWAYLRLSPHTALNMHGKQEISYMVSTSNVSEKSTEQELQHLSETYESEALAIEAVHDVASIQKGNGHKNRVIRTIKPNQVLYYASPDSTFQENMNLFRDSLLEKMLRNGDSEALSDFKHIVTYSRLGNRQAYQYMLPADLPNEFIDPIRSITINVRFGNVKKDTTFQIIRHEPSVLPFRPRTSSDPIETGITSAYKHFVLHPGQKYLEKLLSAGLANLVNFEDPSTTCAEKLKLLTYDKNDSWSLANIISAYYFDGPDGYVVLVGPHLSHIKKVEQFIADIIGKEVKKSEVLPSEMERGTCTPFVRSTTMEKEIDRIILLEASGHMMKLADYSIGGHGPSAHRASIQMTPNTAKELLIEEFGNKVILLPYNY